MSVTLQYYNKQTNSIMEASTPIPAVLVANKYKLNEVPATHTQVSVMRPSVLGNPFKVGDNPGEYKRGEAVPAHETWFREEMQRKDSPVKAEIMRLAQLVANGEKLALVCCCKPKPCHATILAAAITGYAEKIANRNE